MLLLEVVSVSVLAWLWGVFLLLLLVFVVLEYGHAVILQHAARRGSELVTVAAFAHSAEYSLSQILVK